MGVLNLVMTTMYSDQSRTTHTMSIRPADQLVCALSKLQIRYKFNVSMVYVYIPTNIKVSILQ